MKAEIVEDALLLKGRKNVLVVADLHLGLVKWYDRNIIDRLERMFYETEADEIIVLGDLKHRIGGMKVELDLPITVVRGNHDGGLEGVDVVNYLILGRFGLFHGHFVPDLNAKTLVFAHAHPSVMIDGVRERVWMFGEFEGKRIVVMPAFNDLCSSTPVNLRRPAGAMFKRWDYTDAEIITLEGIYLGTVGFLMDSTSRTLHRFQEAP